MLPEEQSLPGAPGSVLAAAISGFSVCSQTSSLPSLSAAHMTCMSPANRPPAGSHSARLTASVRLHSGLPPSFLLWGGGCAFMCPAAPGLAPPTRFCVSGSLCPSLQDPLPFLLVLSDQRGMCRLCLPNTKQRYFRNPVVRPPRAVHTLP